MRRRHRIADDVRVADGDDVSAMDCRGPDGLLLPRDDAIDRLAQAVWHSLRLPVDAVHVRVLQSAEAHGDPAAIVTREELEARFGPGPSGVVWPILERGTGDGVWFLLPVAYVVAGLGFVWLAQRMRPAGIVVVFFRR